MARNKINRTYNRYKKNDIKLIKFIQISILKYFKTTTIEVRKIYINDNSSILKIDNKIRKAKKN